MSNHSASLAGRGTQEERDSRRDTHLRQPIYVEGPQAHAGIVAALRCAFGEGRRLPDNDDDELAALLKKLN